MPAFPERFNLASWLLDERVAEGKGDRVAVMDGDRSFTYRELQRLVNRIGNGLLELDVDMEDRVLLVLPDGVELVAAWLAALKVGAVAVTTHPWMTTPDYERLLDLTRARTLVIDARHRAKVEEAIPSTRHLRRVITVGEPESKEVAWEELASSRFDDLDAAPTHREDVAVWFVSAGETPRAIAHTHHALAQNARSAASRTLGLAETDQVLALGRLSSPVGLVVGLVFPLSLGATVTCHQDRASAASADETVQLRGAVLLGADGCTLQRGAQRIEMLFSEAALLCLSNRWARPRAGTSGQVVDGVEARILGGGGEELSPGRSGGLWIRSEGVLPCFWHDQETEGREVRDGWIHVGDGFSADNEGYFRVQNR